jgi:hypothetical protein
LKVNNCDDKSQQRTASKQYEVGAEPSEAMDIMIIKIKYDDIMI